MFNTHNLPTHGYLRVYVTCDRITPESAENGEAAEMGWVSEVGSSNIQESRNYVTPAFECRCSDLNDEAREELQAVLDSLGAYETDTGSTLYSVDGQILDYTTDDTFMYALHAHVKHYDPARGYVEDDVDITN